MESCDPVSRSYELMSFVFLLDVVLAGEDDHSSGVTRLHQTFDDLVELSVRRLAGNLHRLSDTHPA